MILHKDVGENDYKHKTYIHTAITILVSSIPTTTLVQFDVPTCMRVCAFYGYAWSSVELGVH